MNGVINRLIARVMFIILFFAPVHENNFYLSVKDEVTTESTVICFEYKNSTNRAVHVTELDYIIEKKEGSEWVKINRSPDYVALDSPSRIYPTQKETVEINLMNVFGHLLDEGEYRLVLTYYVWSNHTEGTEMTASANFTVVQK